MGLCPRVPPAPSQATSASPNQARALVRLSHEPGARISRAGQQVRREGQMSPSSSSTFAFVFHGLLRSLNRSITRCATFFAPRPATPPIAPFAAVLATTIDT